MSKTTTRIEIESAENGHIVTVWKSDEESDMYPSPEKYVADDKEAVCKIVEENL